MGSRLLMGGQVPSFGVTRGKPPLTAAPCRGTPRGVSGRAVGATANGLGRFGAEFLDYWGLAGSWRLFLRITWRWRRREAAVRGSRFVLPGWGENAGEPWAAPARPGDWRRWPCLSRAGGATRDASELSHRRQPGPAEAPGWGERGSPSDTRKAADEAGGGSERLSGRFRCPQRSGTCSFPFGCSFLPAPFGEKPREEEESLKKRKGAGWL